MDKKTLAYWIPTGLFAVAIGGSATMNLLRPPELMVTIDALHFPTWFPLWLGAWKLAGVVVLLAPGLRRLKEWATAGFTIALTSASAAHLFNGDAISQAIPPLVLLAICLTSWANRPESRRLSDNTAA